MGSEGEGRVADAFASTADVVARYAGGDNAGHTVRVGFDTFKLPLIPSGILNENAVCVLGAGTVINPLTVLREMSDLAAGGTRVTPDSLAIDPRAHIITPAHIALDGAGEQALGKDAIGTTKRGIGTAYASKMARTGIRAEAMSSVEGFGDLIRRAIIEGDRTLESLYAQPPIDAIAAKTAEYVEAARLLAPYLRDGVALVQDALDEGKRILCEGAQGTLLDIDHGMYPFVTSSTPTVGVRERPGLWPAPCGSGGGRRKGVQYAGRWWSVPDGVERRTGDRLRGTGENPWDEFGTTTDVRAAVGGSIW